ncbi:MAG: PKD domain-containing protein [Flavisolibacter sp.]|nr:PKD domain-containing protein [Flavisolibacter sp.]
MHLQLPKTKLQRFLLSKIALPLIFCCLSALAYAHTIELRAKLNADGSATFYARTYHGMSELPSGGFIIDGVTYPFQGVFSATALPEGTLQISACPYNYSSSDYYQWVTVPNFNSCVAHTFNCTSNSPETPLCNLTNTMTLGAAQITLQPAFANGVACVGQSSNLHVEVTGNNLVYQWQISTGSGFTNITDNGVYSGSTTSTLTISLVDESMTNDVFQCVVSATDNCGNPSSVTSNQVVLAPGHSVAITTQPADVEACFGTNASFSVAATGTNLSYQWQVSTDGGTSFSNLPFATSSVLNLNNLSINSNGYQYRAVVTGTCSVETSNAAVLTVADKAIIVAQPQSQTTCTGGAVTFDATVTGINLSYQWQVSTDGGTSFVNVNGATSTSLTLSNTLVTMNGSQYRLVVSGGCGPDVTTSTVTLTVNSLPSITAQPAPVTVCQGSNAAFYTNATGTAISFQWEESSDDGATWTALQGQTKATLNLSNVSYAMNNHRFRAVVSGTCAPAVTSNAVVLTVNAVAAITSQPQSKVVCAGSNVDFTIAANNNGLDYQWQVSTNNGISFSNINGATEALYSVNTTAAMNGYVYRAVVTGQCGAPAVSETAVLTVNTPPSISVQPVDKSVCAGYDVTFNVTATGSSLSYQWEKSTDDGNTWTTIPGANGASYTVANAGSGQNGTQYRVAVTGTCSQTLASAAAKLTVVKPVAAFDFQKHCENLPVVFTNQSTAVGAGPVNYTWNFGDGSGSSISDATHTYTTAGTYTVQLIARSVACPSLADTASKIIVVDKAIPGARLATIDAISGRSIQLQPRDFSASYKWFTADGSFNSTVKAPQITVQNEKTVYVKMDFASGCTTTDSVLVRLFKKEDVFIPSAFTPDGDGHNDYLKVIMVQARQLKNFRVYNRWGNLVFQTNDPSIGWDGTWRGEKQRSETYLWYCEAVGNDGSIIKKSGSVTLIR